MQKTKKVSVHKSTITLNTGETIHQYTQKVSSKGRSHCEKKLNLGSKKNYIFTEEIFGDKAVFGVEKYDSVGGLKYYGVTYKRSGDDFEFGDLVEVEKVTSFRPVKTGIPMKKSEDFWSGVV